MFCLFGPVVVVGRKGDWVVKECLGGLELLLPMLSIFLDFHRQIL